MLENQFYTRLILNVIFGIMFAYAMFRMASFNNQETVQKKHIITKVVGGLFVLLSCIEVVIFIQSLLNIEFPPTMIEPFLGSNTIVRSSDVSLTWGQPTFAQSMALNQAMGIFTSLGVAIYCLFFKSSFSKWYTKIWKFFLGLLLYAFCVNATKFNYFDFWEFVSPVLFILLLSYIIKRKPTTSKKNLSGTDNQEQLSNNTQSSEYCIDQPTETISFVTHQMTTEFVNRTNSAIVEPSQNNNIEYAECVNIESHSDDSINHEAAKINKATRYCKHCGKQIEADSLFCRYCGGDLRNDVKPRLMNNLSFRISSILSRIHDGVLRVHFSKVSLPQRTNLRRIFKWVGVITVSLMAMFAIGSGIYYYYDTVVPEKKANEILNNQIYLLKHYNGDALYQECRRIIKYKDIPRSGKSWLDDNNLSFLTTEAWSTIKRLANDGNANAQFMLAVLYHGYDFDRKRWNQQNDDSYRSNPNLNYERAAYWYLQSARQGNDAAMNNLANLYYDGNGVEQDYDKAVYWKKLSAEKGNDLAQLLLGDYYRDGIKVETGYEWVKIPDYIGYYNWTYKWGYEKKTIYKTILKQDIDSAKYWWHKSAAQGNETAKERLEKIY